MAVRLNRFFILRKRIQILFLLYLIFFPVSSFAENKMILAHDFEKASLGPYLSILKDETGTLGIHDVSSPEFSKKFTPNSSSSVNLGSTQSVYWFRCSIQAPEKESANTWTINKLNSDECILYLGKHLDFYDNIQMYLQVADPNSAKETAGWQTRSLGMNHAVKTGKRDPLAVTIMVPREESKQIVLYLRIQTSFGLFLDPVLYSPTAFYKFSKKLSLFYGSYYGIVLSLIIFNLFHFYFLRDRVRLIFILYATTLGLYFFVANELSFSIIPASLLPSTLKTAQLLVLLTYIQMLWFTISFLSLKVSQPKLCLFLKIVMFIPTSMIMVLPFFSYSAMGRVIPDVGLFIVFLIIAVGISAWIKGYRPARFFLLGWGFFLLGGIIYALNFKGIFPYPFIGNNAAQIGSGIEMLFISVAIADRIKYLFDQINLAQNKRQKQLNILSQRVAQAEESERRRIAEILHDSIRQTLLAAKWEIEGLISRGKIPKGQDSRLLHSLESSIQQTRTLTAEVYPKELHVFGLKKTIEAMADKFVDRYGLKINILECGSTELKNEQLSIILYRAISELLINIVKHAEASRVEIEISVKDNAVSVVVKDDGTGFDFKIDSDSDIKGFGLFNMQETVHRLGGLLKVESSPIGGAQITLWVPILEKQDLNIPVSGLILH